MALGLPAFGRGRPFYNLSFELLTVGPTWFGGEYGLLQVDFERLASMEYEWDEIYNKGSPDWHDSYTLAQLSTTTLRCAFKLEVDLPLDRLIPRVPARFAYVQFLQCLVDTTGPNFADARETSRRVIGVDINHRLTLLLTQHRQAVNNVALNSLQRSIILSHVSPKGSLIPISIITGNTQSTCSIATFTMTNPPFYASPTERAHLKSLKQKAPHSLNTGDSCENYTDGGELGFSLRHFQESKALGQRIQWYSTLVGRAQTAHHLIDLFKKEQVPNWAVCCIKPSPATRRWILAWSWDLYRPILDAVGGSQKDDLDGRLSENNEAAFSCSGDVDVLFATMHEGLMSLDVEWRPDVGERTGVMLAWSNAWNRRARRRRRRGENFTVPRVGLPLVVAKVYVVSAETKKEWSASHPHAVVVRWMYGVDRGIFDSFVGFLMALVRGAGMEQ
ncbi:MAG: hypothetical protein Q9159_003826 [Coniocarpon cinnabarinum]